MAIAVEQTLNAGVETGNIALSSWTPGAYDFILVTVAYATTLDAPTVSGNGLTFTEIDTVLNAQNIHKLSMYQAQGPSPSTGAITITFDSNTANAHAIATRFSGVARSSPVEATASDAGPPSVDNNDMKVDITTVTANAWAIACGSHRAQNLTVPGGQTGISINNKTGAGGATRSISMWYREVATPATVTLGGDNCLSADVDWCILAISLKVDTGTTYSMNATMAGQTATSAARLAVLRQMTAGMVGQSTTSAPRLAVSRRMAAQMAGQTATPTVVLKVYRRLAAIMRTATVLPDTVPLLTPSILRLAAMMAGVSTVSTAKLLILRRMAANMAGSVEMSTPVLAVHRRFSSVMATTTVASNASLRVRRRLVVLMNAETAIPIQVKLLVLRRMAAVMAGSTRLPDNVTMVVITSTVGFLCAAYALRTPAITARARTPSISVEPRER